MLRTSPNVSVSCVAWLAACAFGALAHAETVEDAAVSAGRNWRVKNERLILNEHIEFVKIPNVSRDKPNVRRNAEHLLGMLKRRGISAKLLEIADAPPLVYGELASPSASSTYVFYGHYDGQPVDAKEWATPPFEPTLRSGRLDKGGEVVALPAGGEPLNPEWRLYARAAADDKAPIMAMLVALDALKSAGIRPRANLKFVFDGEEEIGSPNLARFLTTNRELLRGDLFIVCDGPENPSGRQTVVFGVRGAQTLEITVYGANRELHSGHYGNWAPNPAMMLAQLLASMKDADGRILVPGFYDGVVPLTEVERAAINAIPNDDTVQMHNLSLARTEGGGIRLAELINLPALNIRGISSGHTGTQAANVIPMSATASIDIRLVGRMTRERALASLIQHIENQGYFVTTTEPGETILLSHQRVARVIVDAGGYNAARTPMDLPAAQRVIAALEKARTPLVLQPTMGGSLPLVEVEEILGSPTITVPTVNYDNNQHSKNENLRLGNLWNAIETMAVLFMME
jgi:acetylornithine deacetylase/succinyl-diaminopimelate desuccinylase-like protein